jgi:hypothetical protein
MSKKLFHYTRVYGAMMILRDGVIRRRGKPRHMSGSAATRRTSPRRSDSVPSMEQNLQRPTGPRFWRARVSCSKNATPSLGKTCR